MAALYGRSFVACLSYTETVYKPGMENNPICDLTPCRKNQPRRVTLRVTMDTETRRAAARIGRDYAGRKLETVIAAFVADLAVAADRPGSWEHERVAGWLSSHVWECEPEDRSCR